MDKDRIQYADDEVTPLRRLLLMRFPSLVIGLILGLALSFLTSRFEEVLAHNVSLAFFIPFIVYLADAVGTQTQSIYVRDLRAGRAEFKVYLVKETLLGLALGAIFSVVTGVFVMLWFQSIALTMAVSLAVLCSIFAAPPINIIISELFELEHKDPAVGAAPLATVIQDAISIVLFGMIASAILLP